MKQKTLLQRAEELRQKELTLREITAILLSEGYTTTRGTPIDICRAPAGALQISVG